jgi:hypothetical protein
VAAYGFDENGGTIVTDASGLGNTGTATDTAWTTAGRIGNALVFNGMTSWVTVPGAAALDVTTAMTLEAWVFPTAALSGWVGVMSKERPNAVSYFLYARGTGPPAQGAFIGGNEQILSGTQALQANAWTHLAATYDGAVQRLYVNGVQVSTRNQTGSIAVSTQPLRIGGNAVYGEWFTGRIDEVRVYNRALTQAEIAADMNRPVP